MKIAQKGGLVSAAPGDDTWHAKLTWREGPARMRRALRPRGRAMHGPREAQVAHKWRTGGMGGADTWQKATRVHADDREVRHVARGAGSWRGHGLVGPGYRIGAVTQ